MAEYKSSPVTLLKSADAVYDKLTDLMGLEQAIRNIPADTVPEDKRQMLDDIRVDENTITIPGGPTGAITLVKSDCTRPVLVSYEGFGTPVPVTLAVQIQATGDESCEVTVVADIKVPAMLKPMINGPMQKMVDQVASNLRTIGL